MNPFFLIQPSLTKKPSRDGGKRSTTMQPTKIIDVKVSNDDSLIFAGDAKKAWAGERDN